MATRLGLGLVVLAGTASALAQGPAAAPALTPATASMATAAAPASLREVLLAMEMRSPDMLAAQAVKQQADAQWQQARAAWFGKVDAYASSQHFNDPRLIRPITLPPNVALYPFASNQFGYGVDLQLPIDISGQIAAEVDAARSRSSGAGHNADDARLRTLLFGAALYRNLQAQAAQGAALDKQIESLQLSLRVGLAALKAGEVARVNVLRVEAALADVQAARANVQGQEQRLRAQIAAMLGRQDYPASVAALAAGPTALPALPEVLPPSVQAAQSSLDASLAKLTSAQRALYPQFVVNGGWNRNAVQWDNRAVSTWQVNLGVRINLWSGLAQRSAIEAARGAQVEAGQRLQSALDNLQAARAGAVAQWHTQQQAWRAAESGLQAATESASIERSRFKTGLSSATDLIDAEAALARARAGVATAIAGWWQADDALRYAYGQAPADLQAAPISDAERRQP